MYTTILYNFINTQEAWVTTQFVTLHSGSDVCSKKSQNTPRPSEHPPVMGSKVSFRYRCRRFPGKLYKTLCVAKDQPPPTSNIPLGIKTFRWDQRL